MGQFAADKFLGINRPFIQQLAKKTIVGQPACACRDHKWVHTLSSFYLYCAQTHRGEFFPPRPPHSNAVDLTSNCMTLEVQMKLVQDQRQARHSLQRRRDGRYPGNGVWPAS